MKARRAALALVLVAVALAALAGPARAQTTTSTTIADAAEALRSDPVYVAPGASSILSAGEADDLRARIEEADAGPIYVAVFPDEIRREAGGSADGVLRDVYEALGEDATYAVVVGGELRAGSNYPSYERGTVPALADEAVSAAGSGDAGAVLTEFVTRLEEEATGGSGGIGILPVLLLAGAAIFLFTTVRRRRQRRREDAEHYEEVRQATLDDLVALGEDLRALDLDVEMPGADPRAKQSYVSALECYERATDDFDRARRVEDLRPVTSALEEGRYAMASARARLEGREPPEHRPPCFFDPRHGPSERDVEWAPPGGRPRLVPACAADAERVESGDEPESREVTVGGRSVPYWNAPGYYGPWAGGYFGGGLLEGMLIGSMLGGFGSSGGDGGDSGGFGDFGGGDSGGFGDFGGGDFGGGDFGGGDFGGGDFGGGDFGG